MATKQRGLTETQLQQIESTSEAVRAPAPQKARVYLGEEILDHDLFKLNVAVMMKDVSWNGVPNLIPTEHCHFFHNIDSQGRKMENSASVGGHFHVMTLVGEKDGVPLVTCGPAARYVMKKINGQLRKVVEELKNDTHIHEVEYKYSERIQPRKPNGEWAKVEGIINALVPKNVEGVI